MKATHHGQDLVILHLKRVTMKLLRIFLMQVYQELFNPQNRKWVNDNLTSDKRDSLRAIGKWNKDHQNPRVVRVEDKGSGFVIDWKKTTLGNALNLLVTNQLSQRMKKTGVRRIRKKLGNGPLSGTKKRSFQRRKRTGL